MATQQAEAGELYVLAKSEVQRAKETTIRQEKAKLADCANCAPYSVGDRTNCCLAGLPQGSGGGSYLRRR
jgi:hypothetical protein